MLNAQDSLGKYEYTSIASIVSARLQDFEVIEAMIDEAAANPTLAISTRITELEAVKSCAEKHIAFLKKQHVLFLERRRKRK